MPGGTSSGVGLQVLSEDLILNNVLVPAGSLLVSNWNANPDQIFAVDPTDGIVLSTLVIAENIDPVGLAYDTSNGGHLYVLDNGPDRVVEINPADGVVVGSITVPLDVNAGGLAVHPGTGHLWVGSHLSSTVVELQPDGTVLQQLDLAPQSIAGEISGLAFNDEDQLLASSLRGVVYVLDLP